jgi:hypothetical protein
MRIIIRDTCIRKKQWGDPERRARKKKQAWPSVESITSSKNCSVKSKNDKNLRECQGVCACKGGRN